MMFFMIDFSVELKKNLLIEEIIYLFPTFNRLIGYTFHCSSREKKHKILSSSFDLLSVKKETFFVPHQWFTCFLK